MKANYQWLAVYTKSRAEKKLHSSLVDNEIECYLPLIKELRQRSDRKIWVTEPLIKSYLFVRVSEYEYYNVLNTPGSVCYVTFNGKAAPIPDWQIQGLKDFLQNGQRPIEITTEELSKGDIMEVTNGPLKGVRGELVQIRGQNRIVLRFKLLGCSVHSSVNLSEVKPIGSTTDGSND